MKRLPLAVLSVVSIAMLPSAVWGQDKKDAAKGSVSYAVPDAPALTLLGASSAKVSQPGNARDFAAQLVNAFDEAGRVRQGIAIDVRPAYIAPVSLAQYQHFWSRLWYNAGLSVGTVQTPGQTGSTDIALGLRLTLVDKGDRMLDPSYVTMLETVINDCKPTQPHQAPALALTCMKELSKKGREEWLKAHWNAFRLSAAIASGWRAPGSVLKNSESSGWSTWISGAVPARHWGQIVGQARYVNRNNAVPAVDTPPEEISLGARGFVGTGTLNGFVELAYVAKYDLPATLDTGGATTWSAGLEYRIAETTWISASLGSGGRTQSGERQASFIANLRFGLADESRIKP
jgi:hypothetical protein